MFDNRRITKIEGEEERTTYALDGLLKRPTEEWNAH